MGELLVDVEKKVVMLVGDLLVDVEKKVVMLGTTSR